MYTSFSLWVAPICAFLEIYFIYIYIYIYIYLLVPIIFFSYFYFILSFSDFESCYCFNCLEYS
jgi:hypothetical protein